MKDAATTMPTASGGAVGRTNRPTRRAPVSDDPPPHQSACHAHLSNRGSDHLPDAVHAHHGQRHVAKTLRRSPGGDAVVAAAVTAEATSSSPWSPAMASYQRGSRALVSGSSTPCRWAALSASSASLVACRNGKPGTNSPLSIAAPFASA